MPAGQAEPEGEMSESGEFRRQESRFRNWVTSDGSSRFAAEPGRYHLYVSYACPWAHRAIIVRLLKGLDDVVTMSAVDPIRDDRGWRFGQDDGWSGPDPVNGFEFLSEAYAATDPDFEGRVTVPALWDRETKTVVNNESSDVMRMLNRAWDEFAQRPEVDLYPEDLRTAIDSVNERVYPNVNNGVYRAGFAATQQAYERAFDDVFSTLDWLEARLGESAYLAGDRVTEADWRLWTTLLRFDAVYLTHFKCNLRRICDYANLTRLLRELYRVPGIADTVNMDHIKRHYYMTHETLNPRRIVAKGPELHFLD